MIDLTRLAALKTRCGLFLQKPLEAWWNVMKKALFLLLLLALSGCSTTQAPENDTGFASVAKLEDFAGCYKNCSSPAGGSSPVCLTSILWPGQFSAETQPEAVAIRSGSGSSLIASAILDNTVIQESRFEEGKHFHFRDGRIELNRDFLASGAREPGNPFIGLATSSTELGLDASGQGRISRSTAFAGTGFLIVPIAGKTSTIQKIDRAPSDLCAID